MSPRSLTCSALAAALLLTVAAGSAAAPRQAAQVEPTDVTSIGDAYYPWDGNGGINVLHYDIHDTYAFGRGQLTGRTVVTLRAKEDLDRFALDLLLPVREVRIDGARVGHRKPNRHEVVITPDAVIPAGEEVRVRVEYGGRPDEIAWKGESNWLANRREVVTMNEPHMAAWWFPANDHPRDKARFDIRITTGSGKRVVSNGRLVGRRVTGDRATTHWRMGDPMTTYLAYFAAGDFAVERGRTGGIPWYNAVSRSISGWRYEMRALRRSGRITAWLASELGEYPFGTTGGLVTDLQVGFALENQTRPTYPAGAVSVDLLVHELAHQWFGNSVSVHRWQDIWLNEGFAVYLEARYAEAHGGPTTDRWLRSLHGWYPAGDQFWDLNIADPGPRRLFESAVYERGGMALAALRSRIGMEDFRRLLRRWVAERHDGTATVEAFETLAENVSGEELSEFFDVWLRRPDKPARTAANGF